MSGSGEVLGGQVCAYPDCSNPVVRHGAQGAVPKRYCSASCRTRDSRRRADTSFNDPESAIRAAVEQALRSLMTEQVNGALPFAQADLQNQFKKVRAALEELHQETSG